MNRLYLEEDKYFQKHKDKFSCKRTVLVIEWWVFSVTLMTILDKLWNSNHDIYEGDMTDRVWNWTNFEFFYKAKLPNSHYRHLTLVLIQIIKEVKLVGGSGPHEGNILVGGLPVCDDSHDSENALVVCRCKYQAFWVFYLHECSECLGIHMDGLQFNPTLEMSTIRLQWTTCNAWEMRPLSLIALMSLSMIARGVKGQE